MHLVPWPVTRLCAVLLAALQGQLLLGTVLRSWQGVLGKQCPPAWGPLLFFLERRNKLFLFYFSRRVGVSDKEKKLHCSETHSLIPFQTERFMCTIFKTSWWVTFIPLSTPRGWTGCTPQEATETKVEGRRVPGVGGSLDQWEFQYELAGISTGYGSDYSCWVLTLPWRARLRLQDTLNHFFIGSTPQSGLQQGDKYYRHLQPQWFPSPFVSWAGNKHGRFVGVLWFMEGLADFVKMDVCFTSVLFLKHSPGGPSVGTTVKKSKQQAHSEWNQFHSKAIDGCARISLDGWNRLGWAFMILNHRYVHFLNCLIDADLMVVRWQTKIKSDTFLTLWCCSHLVIYNQSWVCLL